MAPTKQKGDMAELRVASDLVRQGYRIALPFGEDCDFDLVLLRGERFERVQVKHVTSDGRVVEVKCTSYSLTHGKARAVKKYTAQMIDWLAAYDATTDRCFYIPAHLLGNGRTMFSMRLAPTLNNQVRGTRWAHDFTELGEWSQSDSNRRPRQCKCRALAN